MEEHKEAIAGTWLELMSKDTTFSVVSGYTRRQVDELLWLFVCLLKQVWTCGDFVLVS